MTSKQHRENSGSEVSKSGIAFGSILASALALISAAACCVLPLVLVSFGLGATALSFLVPYHWPLTIVAGLAIAAGWVVFFRGSPKGRRRTSTLALLSSATLLLAFAIAWKPYLEVPLIAWVGP